MLLTHYYITFVLHLCTFKTPTLGHKNKFAKVDLLRSVKTTYIPTKTYSNIISGAYNRKTDYYSKNKTSKILKKYK